MAEWPAVLEAIGAAATGTAQLVRAFNDPLSDFGTPFTGGVQVGGLRLTAANGAAAACPPARPRMPTSLQMADPCAPNNPTFYLKAGKASAAMWPGVLAGQAKKLARANKAVPKKTVRQKKAK